MHGITFLYMAMKTISSAFPPMTEDFHDEWGDGMVPVQLGILIKELGDHVGHIAVQLAWLTRLVLRYEGETTSTLCTV